MLVLRMICRLSGFMNQGSIQVDILIEIANKIRAGNYTGTIGAPKKLIIVGHSFGSAISLSTVAEAPNVADAVVLTGLAFAQNGQVALEALAPRIASTQNAKWNDLDAGYLTSADIWANINWYDRLAAFPSQTHN
jgi:pimeloyl-ACP methyl ester carboxylesterase